MKDVKRKKTEWYKELQNIIKVESSASATKIVDPASEKGASCWLTSTTIPNRPRRAKEQFHGINITDQGHKYLGSYIGSDN